MGAQLYWWGRGGQLRRDAGMARTEGINGLNCLVVVFFCLSESESVLYYYSALLLTLAIEADSLDYGQAGRGVGT